jgi:UMF1 family MFS transporter
MLKLLPPEKRGAIRGIGFAIGSIIGVGLAALIPAILGGIIFPYNFVLIFFIGSMLLVCNAVLFLNLREHEDAVSRVPMGITQYIKGFKTSVGENAAFRTLIITCTFLVVANSLLSYYTLYAIRVFSATESHIATLAALAVVSSAVGFIVFGFVVDRRGPNAALITAACFIISASLFALATNSLNLLFAAWILANLGNTSYGISASLMLGLVSPSNKLPLYVGVLTMISLAASAAVVLLLAPILEHVGFTVLFVTVFVCGAASLSVNLLILRKKLSHMKG